jgi:hypothetical protein
LFAEEEEENEGESLRAIRPNPNDQGGIGGGGPSHDKTSARDGECSTALLHRLSLFGAISTFAATTEAAKISFSDFANSSSVRYTHTRETHDCALSFYLT